MERRLTWGNDYDEENLAGVLRRPGTAKAQAKGINKINFEDLSTMINGEGKIKLVF